MKLASREEIARIDRKILLMPGWTLPRLIDKVGEALADACQKLDTFTQNRKSLIGIWCGAGNNGQDGKALAKHLRVRGWQVETVEGLSWDETKYSVLIDALFGVGLSRPLSPEMAAKIQKVHQRRIPVVAIDLPSGLEANTGQILGAGFRAHTTLAIWPLKPGHFLNEGPQHCGKIVPVKVDFPSGALDEADSVYLIGDASARRLLPPRSLGSNKTSFGHVLVIAGSGGMEGAALLSAEGAARMGCGYVTLCSDNPELFRQAKPDFLRLSLEDFFKKDLRKYSAVVVGPGLGISPKTEKILRYLKEQHERVVVDADALTVYARSFKSPLPPEWIVTPHAGELSRILDIPAKALEADRLVAVQQAQEVCQSVILLKGFRTVIRGGSKSYIIGSGNVALAKAGSGDVLSGFIGSLMAQGLSTLKAGVLGAYLHGKIADDWLRRGHSTRTLMASDLPELIDASLRSLKKRGQ